MIVPNRKRARLLAAGVLGLWALTVAVTAVVASRQAAPTLVQVRSERERLENTLARANAELEQLRQQTATLGRAEEITRNANLALQRDLTEREEEMAQLRADVAFYERLVGASGQRKGLSVHSIGFAPGSDGLWSYRVTLVQNLNRGKVSKGAITLSLDGVRNGRLESLDWPELRQQTGAAAQDFSFRYFQQLEGNVMLPAGFQPHRVRVAVRAEGASIEQVFPWETVLASGPSGDDDVG